MQHFGWCCRKTECTDGQTYYAKDQEPVNRTERNETGPTKCWSKRQCQLQPSTNAFDHFYLNNDYSVIKIYNFLHVYTLYTFGMPKHRHLFQQFQFWTTLSRMCVPPSMYCFSAKFRSGFSAILLVDSVCASAHIISTACIPSLGFICRFCIYKIIWIWIWIRFGGTWMHLSVCNWFCTASNGVVAAVVFFIISIYLRFFVTIKSCNNSPTMFASVLLCPFISNAKWMDTFNQTTVIWASKLLTFSM